MTEIWLTEFYFEEFTVRRGILFSQDEAIEVYAYTQLLQQRWPGCISSPPPEIGSKHGLFYSKFDWPACRLRICWGAQTEDGVQKIVALTCRTKQEVSSGSSNGTQEWYRHMRLVGLDQWDSYRWGLVPYRYAVRPRPLGRWI